MDLEAGLLNKAVQGDADSFGQLVERYYADIVRTVSFASADMNARDDLVQETFLRAYRRIHTFDTNRPLRNWLITIALNVCRNHHRNSRFTLPWQHALDRVHAGFEGEVAERAVLRDVLQCMARLRPIYREIMTLHYVHELSLTESAQVLGIRVGTAKSRLSKALTHMRRSLAKVGYDAEQGMAAVSHARVAASPNPMKRPDGVRR